MVISNFSSKISTFIIEEIINQCVTKFVFFSLNDICDKIVS